MTLTDLITQATAKRRRWASAKSADESRIDRYVVETPQGCRTVSARGLEAAQR